MSTEELIDIARQQLEGWPMAADNYRRLSEVRRHDMRYGDLTVSTQFNPARAVSTGAKVDAKTISERPCFLCDCNRPEQQTILEHFGDWQVLLNPFPIFHTHFTITHSRHQHQDNIDFSDMAEFTLTHPGLLTFYNGSASGASCPDHLHFQATLSTELTICRYVEDAPGELVAMIGTTRIYIVDDLPAVALHIVSDGKSPLTQQWADALLKPNDYGIPDKSLRNLLMWTDENGMLHTLLFPREKHRPECYTSEASDTTNGKHMVSPGAVDMAGLVVTPRLCDFESLDVYTIARILAEVSYDFTSSEMLRNLLMR